MGYKMLKFVKESLEEKGYCVTKIEKSGKGNDVTHRISVSTQQGDHSWFVSVSSVGGWRKW